MPNCFLIVWTASVLLAVGGLIAAVHDDVEIAGALLGCSIIPSILTDVPAVRR